MGFLKRILVGRDNGTRAAARRRLFGTHLPPESASTDRLSAANPDAVVRLSGGPVTLPDVTPPEGFTVVLHTDALPPGAVAELIVGGTALAVYNVDGVFYAISNACPHAGGALGRGTRTGTTLRCPDHGWRFDLTDGSCLRNPTIKVPIHMVHIEGEAVCVRL